MKSVLSLSNYPCYVRNITCTIIIIARFLPYHTHTRSLSLSFSLVLTHGENLMPSLQPSYIYLFICIYTYKVVYVRAVLSNKWENWKDGMTTTKIQKNINIHTKPKMCEQIWTTWKASMNSFPCPMAVIHLLLNCLVFVCMSVLFFNVCVCEKTKSNSVNRNCHTLTYHNKKWDPLYLEWIFFARPVYFFFFFFK